MTEENTRVTRRFVYAGRLLTTKKALCHTWLEADDPERVRLLPKAKATVIGGIYTIDVDGDQYYPGSVAFTGERVEPEEVAALEAAAHAEGVRHAQAALEKNMARESELKALCAPLRALVGKQVGWANRSALLAYITTEIGRG